MQNLPRIIRIIKSRRMMWVGPPQNEPLVQRPLPVLPGGRRQNLPRIIRIIKSRRRMWVGPP
jgi:hypothetical protein